MMACTDLPAFAAAAHGAFDDERDAAALAFLVRLAPTQHHFQALGREAEVPELERVKLASAKRTGEPEREQREVPLPQEPFGQGGHQGAEIDRQQRRLLHLGDALLPSDARQDFLHGSVGPW